MSQSERQQVVNSGTTRRGSTPNELLLGNPNAPQQNFSVYPSPPMMPPQPIRTGMMFLNDRNLTWAELEFTELFSWLESFRMEMHIQAFVNSGFTLEILKYYGISDFQLANMQIMDPTHRNTIVTEVNKLRQEYYGEKMASTTTPTTSTTTTTTTSSLTSSIIVDDDDESKVCVICFEGPVGICFKVQYVNPLFRKKH